MKAVTIVVLNWNGWADTIACLESIEKVKVEGFSLKTVIVDNASTNDSVKRIKGSISKKHNAVVIENKRNLGFAGGNNVGIQYALADGCDYVMLLNNDTVLDVNTVIRLFEFFELNKIVGVASPKIYFAKGFEFHDKYKKNELGKVIWYAGGNIDWNNVYGSNYGVDEVDTGQFDKNHETPFATGACMFLRTSTLEKVGVLDEKYFLYLEDADLSIRIKKAGLKVYFVANSFLWHKVSQSSGIGSDLNDYFITRNRMLFGIRYASLRAKIALVRESARLYVSGRPWQRVGIKDYYLGRFGQGSWGAHKK